MEEEDGNWRKLIQRRQPEFVPPRKPYSLFAILDDILQFAAETLIDNGRLSFWMPTANDEEQEMPIPTHPYLEIVAVSTQTFNKCEPDPPPGPLFISIARQEHCCSQLTS